MNLFGNEGIFSISKLFYFNQYTTVPNKMKHEKSKNEKRTYTSMILKYNQFLSEYQV